MKNEMPKSHIINRSSNEKTTIADSMKSIPVSSKISIVQIQKEITEWPKHFVKAQSPITACPNCGNREGLRLVNVMLPLKKQGVAISFMAAYCPRCRTEIIDQRLNIDGLLLKDTYTQLGLSEKKNIGETVQIPREPSRKERKKRLSKIPSAVVMICVKYDNQEIVDYIIVKDKDEEDNNEIIHYSSNKGLELLSAAFANQRGRRGTLQGRNYGVIRRVFPGGNNGIPDYFIPTEVVIQKGGGYSSEEQKNKNIFKNIDTLLYGPETDRYEILHTTLNTKTGEFYVDLQLYRRFYKEFGRPETPSVYFGGLKERWGRRRSFDDLNPESILKIFGYDVSRAASLSDRIRHDILEELVDYKFLSIHEIVRYIEFFITSHSGDRYYNARNVWESDIRHIQNYKNHPKGVQLGGVRKAPDDA